MDKKLFFKLYRKYLDKDHKLTQREVDALEFFIDKMVRVKSFFTVPQWAYVMATTFHETAHTFEPVREAFHLSENWRKRNLRYYPYYGRGYVQLTWDYNYERYQKILDQPLLSRPDLAMQPETSFNILVHGMKHGVFTGKKLSDYVNENRKRYDLARYVINGRDKRDLIAKYAEMFEYILNKTMQ